MVFGGYDNTLIKEGDSGNGYGIHWYPLTGKTWWQIQIQDVLYGGTSVFSNTAKNCIIDSGTSLIALPSSEWTKIMQTIINKYSYDMACDTSAGICGFLSSCSNYFNKLDTL